MKKLLLLVFLVSKSLLSQNIGYEMRTNGKSYLTLSYNGFELRHRTNLKENRFTYRHIAGKENKLYISVPLHYKIEKNQPTLEPRLTYKFKQFNLWIQHEFWYKQEYNTAIAVDIKTEKMKYRVGWDDSNTIRFRITFLVK